MRTTPVPVAPAERLFDDPDALLIDLRSQSEFAEDHRPGAHNVPLFDDDDRALIGTLYRQESPAAAFRVAAERTVAGIGAMVAKIAGIAEWTPPDGNLEQEVRRRTEHGYAVAEGQLVVERLATLPERPVFLSCWRGGLRSRSVIAFLRDLGLERAVGVEGGYKAYRRCVRERLDAWDAPPTFVLRGLTGVGKTLVLGELEALRPGWTVDLEELAQHRSSILGMVGRRPVSQKAFESRTLQRLERGLGREVCVFEGESRKVGNSIVPARVWDALANGVSLELTASTERRVDVLIEDYLKDSASRAELRRQLPFIEKRLGPVKWAGELVRRLDDGRERELVEILLERYYDPLYRSSEADYTYAHRVDTGDPARAAGEIVDWIEGALRAHQPAK